MDRDRFPLASAYLDRLPVGILSHPQCQVKASIFLDQHATRPLPDEDLERFPREVVELVRDPPPLSAWIPEVVAMTYLVGVREKHFPPPIGDAEYEEWTYERNRRLLGGRLYRAVFLLVSPERLFRHVDRRWNRVRRGSRIELVEQRPGYARLTTHYPSFLHDESVAIGMRGAMRAVAELAGAKKVEITVPDVRERSTSFEVRYEA